MSERDPYQVLGVAKNADQDTIKKAYRSLAKKLHPDLNPGDAKAEERFKSVSDAFDTLSDPDRRKLFDQFGHASRRPGFDAEQARAYQNFAGRSRGGSGFEDIFGGMPGGGGGGGRDFGDMFSEILREQGRGGKKAPAQGPTRGQDLESEVRISLREAYFGCERTFEVKKPARCGGCHGEGAVRDELGQRVACSACGSQGSVLRSSRLKTKIPAGIQNKQTIRLARQGSPGTLGGPDGDLNVVVVIQEHPLLRRDGDDLHLDMPISIPELLLGTQMTVPTFGGDLKMKIPQGAANGSELRLKGKGMRKPGQPSDTKTPESGDMYVRLCAVLPEGEHKAQDLKAAADAIGILYTQNIRPPMTL